MICVPLIEHSHQSKTRLLALHECRTCVENVGLSGLGKKGLLVTAKTLSKEHLPENRAAALDLIETVLAKMDGDVDKLASICGTEYLSDKGRAMIEERWKKHEGSHQSMPQTGIQRKDRSRRQSRIPSSRAAFGASRTRQRATSPIAERRHSDPDEADDGSGEGLRDELPSFKLELDGFKTTSRGANRSAGSTAPVSGPFTFSFSTTADDVDGNDVAVGTNDEVSQRQVETTAAVGSITQGGMPTNTLPATSSSVPTEGAAASLRARLLKIRQKQREESAAQQAAEASACQREETTTREEVAHSSSLQPALSPSDISSPLIETPVEQPMTEKATTRVDTDNSYESLHSIIEELLHTKPPVPDAHPSLQNCTSTLKKYHAAISNQPGAAPDMSYEEFSNLKQNISDKTVEVIENLTR